MIRVGIVGISGYTGKTALEILLNHPDVRVTYVSANDINGNVADIWPDLSGLTKLSCKDYNSKQAIKNCDLVFLAVPHTVSIKIAPELIKAKLKVIDFSADYRLKNAKQYKQWYKKEHTDSINLKKAIYGLPELYRENIKKANLIANPGCYPTAALLALTPFTSLYGELIDSIIIDAKSGISGAGRKPNRNLLFPEINENFMAYKVLNHQHTPEIVLYLSKVSKVNFNLNFIPHLLPINRGILETIYVKLKDKLTVSNLYNVYKKFYKTEPFVRVYQPGLQPQLKNVVKSNFCDIGLEISKDKKLIVITSAIDNLVKGAAGQAVQNMNIMFEFKETEGLI